MPRSLLHSLVLLALLLITSDLFAAGAIAIDERGRRESMVVNFPTQRQADREALRVCGHHCRVVGRLTNECGAIAWPKHGGAWIWSDGFRNERAAAGAAAHRCREATGGHQCRVRAMCDGPTVQPHHHHHHGR
ncbi:MAG: DUF4189 domain-containing protein [Magnetococcus sp. YQC-9]